MAVKLSTAVRNAQLDAIETAIGASPILQIRTGPAPANCAAVDSGTLLASMTLPADWMDAAVNGSKAKAGTWQDPSGDADGDAAYFRIKDASGTVCHLQGSVTGTAGDGNIKLSSVSISVGQQITITAFGLNAGNG